MSEINCSQCKGDGGYDYCICGGSGFGYLPLEEKQSDLLNEIEDKSIHLKSIESKLNKLVIQHTPLTNKQIEEIQGMYYFVSTLNSIESTPYLMERIEKIMSFHNKSVILKKIVRESLNSESLSIFSNLQTDEIIFGITKHDYYGNDHYKNSVHSKRLVFPTIRHKYAVFSSKSIKDIFDKAKEVAILKGGAYDFYDDLGTAEDFLRLECKFPYLKLDFVDLNNPEISYKFLIRTATFKGIIASQTQKVINETIQNNYFYDLETINLKKWF